MLKGDAKLECRLVPDVTLVAGVELLVKALDGDMRGAANEILLSENCDAEDCDVGAGNLLVYTLYDVVPVDEIPLDVNCASTAEDGDINPEKLPVSTLFDAVPAAEDDGNAAAWVLKLGDCDV